MNPTNVVDPAINVARLQQTGPPPLVNVVITPHKVIVLILLQHYVQELQSPRPNKRKLAMLLIKHIKVRIKMVSIFNDSELDKRHHKRARFMVAHSRHSQIN